MLAKPIPSVVSHAGSAWANLGPAASLAKRPTMPPDTLSLTRCDLSPFNKYTWAKRSIKRITGYSVNYQQLNSFQTKLIIRRWQWKLKTSRKCCSYQTTRFDTKGSTESINYWCWASMWSFEIRRFVVAPYEREQIGKYRAHQYRSHDIAHLKYTPYELLKRVGQSLRQ